MTLDESALLRLLHSTEHTFVERKTVGDSRDWIKTVVAFANTLDPSQEAVLFIGAKDSGEIEPTSSNLDSLQKKLSDKMQDVYPPIYYTTTVVKEADRECLAVIIPGSSATPHFTGSPYLRDGSQSIKPTSEQYEKMLAARISKAQELQRWIGKDITLLEFQRTAGIAYVVNKRIRAARVVACNQFYVTVMAGDRFSYPLGKLDIAYDQGSNRLQLELSLSETTH